MKKKRKFVTIYKKGKEGSMEFKVGTFEGPLDLLLHLIKENKMDILNIEVGKITEQYLQYIHQLQHHNLEVASNYLVVASELIELKAKMLLPHPEQTETEEVEEDPRQTLVSRLLEYQAYKEISKTLKAKEEQRREIHTKPQENRNLYLEETISFKEEGSLENLIGAFQKFLARKEEEKPLKTKVTMKEITVSSRKLEIRNRLRKEKRISFFHLFPDHSKEYIVATFLAILEMARSKELQIEQDSLFAEIFCQAIN